MPRGRSARKKKFLSAVAYQQLGTSAGVEVVATPQLGSRLLLLNDAVSRDNYSIYLEGLGTIRDVAQQSIIVRGCVPHCVSVPFALPQKWRHGRLFLGQSTARAGQTGRKENNPKQGGRNQNFAQKKGSFFFDWSEQCV